MKQTFYFAYGSNMDDSQMKYRCPFARKVGVGFLPKHELFVSHNSMSWNGGVFSIKENTKNDVFGVVYDVTPSCIQSLDIYEGFPKVYTKKTMQINELDFNKKRKSYDCIVYVSNIIEDYVTVSEDYYNVCLDATLEHNIKLNF